MWDMFKGTVIHLKTEISVKGVLLTLAGATFIGKYGTDLEKLQNLKTFVDFGAQVVALLRGSVVIVLKVSSISSLKRLWQSYKDGSLKEKLKKSLNEEEELKELSQGEEIDVEVTIDEEEYHAVLWNLILLDVKGKPMKNGKSQRRHSVCCERDVPQDSSKPMDVKGVQRKGTTRKRRHSVCCERDVPEDIDVKGKSNKSQRRERDVPEDSSKPMDVKVCYERDVREDSSGKPIDVAQIQTRVGRPVTELEKSEDGMKQINLMATSWVSPRKENLNFAHLSKLLIDGGTRALRVVFDSIHSPISLHRTLLSTTVHSTLKGLRAKRILTKQQWERLYPASRSTAVTSVHFDITLLFVLLRNICGLTPPPTGWDKPPVATDQSREADLARVKYYRNKLYGHITETAVSDSDFEKYWSEISDVLVRLGGPHYEPEIERLKIIAMDVEDEKYFIKILEDWEQTEQSLKTAIKNTEQRLMYKLEEMGEKLVLKEVMDMHKKISLQEHKNIQKN
ncbi:uncharacterized protein LOC116286561 [Actinia tenebrosa]|uniref:Uncharacterized protein LOC116286561 n=1 Tax=Actinia tenebrosa TaxID=6105 RepID=A0A6P8H963_ACTTE|nr:uncharacterized protein LOC116286561 [Actinia tenebrosa]